ncbi:MAG TPA: hypothetical protein VGC85_07320 [Chthoniobacterales bacterium]|jgi:hypothetical protein
MTTLRRISKALFVATLLCASLALIAPRHAIAAPTAKHDCCAHTEMHDNAPGDCPMHHNAPAKKQSDSSCCVACAAGLALLLVAPPDFVYAQTGEQRLVSLNDRSHSLPHRPPVPPPRVAFA